MPSRAWLVTPLFVALLSGGATGCRIKSSDPSQPIGVQEGLEAAPCDKTADCPATGQPCVAAVCVEGECRAQPAAAGSPLAQQQKGDCKSIVCDGRGNALPRKDDKDVPPDDDNECTREACSGGTADSDYLAPGAPCGEAGVCNGTGKCGVCLPNAKRCAGGGIQSCAATGQWAGATACPMNAPVCGAKTTCIGVAQIAAGGQHTCTVLADGSVRCWGASLADDGPARVGGLSGAAEIAVGGGHACARAADGGVSCWGQNSWGELGDGTNAARATPAPVQGVAGATQIDLGDAFGCARLDKGTVACWGRNDRGQLGSGSVNKPAKVMVPDDPRAPGKAAPAARPVTIAVGPVAQIAAGSDRTCARLLDGTVSCWGAAPRTDPIPPAVKAAKPVTVKGLSKVAEIAVGHSHACVRLEDGAIKCWGHNAHGQLGDGSKTDRSAPVSVKDVKGAVGVVAGGSHTCAVLQGGTLSCWGMGTAGQLGNGGTEDSNVPTKAGMASASVASAGNAHTCVVFGGGAAACWGDGSRGQLGDGSTGSRPIAGPVAW